MSKTTNIDENGNAVSAQKKRNGAARARQWRADKKVRRIPLPRAVDAALVEAMAFDLAAAVRDGVNIETVCFAPLRLASIARLCLERDGSDPALVGKAITRRLKKREPHTRPHYVPSLQPGDLDRIPPPQGDAAWSSPIGRIFAFLGAPSRTI